MTMIEIRSRFTQVEDRLHEAGQWAATPLRRVAVGLVVGNPLAGRWQADLSDWIAASAALGDEMGAMLLAAMDGRPVESYGKAGIVGLAGELEHANMLLTTTFANPVRAAIGGAAAWISSNTKIGAPGCTIDVPLNHKDAIYVRSHYGTMSVTPANDVPRADEIALIFCATSGGRLNARVGGLAASEVKGLDGLS